MSKEAPFEALVTDVDRTILDTRAFIFEAFRHTLQNYKLPSITQEDLDPLMGKPLEECYAFIAPHSNPFELAETHRSFQDAHLGLSTPFPHTKQTIWQLHTEGLKIAAVTTRSQRSSAKTLELAGLMPFIETVVSKEDVDPHELKPHPKPILLALERLKVAPERAISMGDTNEDIVSGKSAGTKTIGVTYGAAGQYIKESNPDYVVDDIKEIVSILLPS